MCARGLFSAMGALSLNILQQAHFPFGMGKCACCSIKYIDRYLYECYYLYIDSYLCEVICNEADECSSYL